MNLIILWSHEERCKCAYKCNDVGTLQPLIDFFFFLATCSCTFVIPVQFIVRRNVKNGSFTFTEQILSAFDIVCCCENTFITGLKIL